MLTDCVFEFTFFILNVQVGCAVHSWYTLGNWRLQFTDGVPAIPFHVNVKSKTRFFVKVRYTVVHPGGLKTNGYSQNYQFIPRQFS